MHKWRSTRRPIAMSFSLHIATAYTVYACVFFVMQLLAYIPATCRDLSCVVVVVDFRRRGKLHWRLIIRRPWSRKVDNYLWLHSKPSNTHIFLLTPSRFSVMYFVLLIFFLLCVKFTMKKIIEKKVITWSPVGKSAVPFVFLTWLVACIWFRLRIY